MTSHDHFLFGTFIYHQMQNFLGILNIAMTKLRDDSIWSNLQNGHEKPAIKIPFWDYYTSSDVEFSWHYEFSGH